MARYRGSERRKRRLGGRGTCFDRRERAFVVIQRRQSCGGGNIALVRKVVDRMNGKVGVESEVGKGTRFWIELKSADGLAPRRSIATANA